MDKQKESASTPSFAGKDFYLGERESFFFLSQPLNRRTSSKTLSDKIVPTTINKMPTKKSFKLIALTSFHRHPDIQPECLLIGDAFSSSFAHERNYNINRQYFQVFQVKFA